MTESNAGYQPSVRIERLWQRAQGQPEEMFLHGLRAYYYLEGWMGAKGESLAMRNVCALGNVFENMPLVMFPGEIIVGESGNPQCEGLINFHPPDAAAYREYAAAGKLSDEQRDSMSRWLADEPFAHFRLPPAPPEMRLAEQHGVIAVWGTDLNHSIRGYEKVLKLGFDGLKREVESALGSISIAEPDAAQCRAKPRSRPPACVTASRARPACSRTGSARR